MLARLLKHKDVVVLYTYYVSSFRYIIPLILSLVLLCLSGGELKKERRRRRKASRRKQRHGRYGRGK